MKSGKGAKKDPRAKAQLKALEEEAAELKAKQEALISRWEEEKARLARFSELKEEIEDAGTEIDQAESEEQLQKAAELKCDRPSPPSPPPATYKATTAVAYK